MAIAERIREYRNQLGLGQRELAEMAGLTRDQLASIETQRREVSSSEVTWLADALGVEVEDLLQPTPVQHYRNTDLDPASQEVVELVSRYARESAELRNLEWLYEAELAETR